MPFENKIIPSLAPNVEDHLKTINYNLPIDLDNHEELIYKIRSYVGLDFNTIQLIIKAIFLEMRNVILSRENLLFSEMGILKHNSKNRYSFKIKRTFRRIIKNG